MYNSNYQYQTSDSYDDRIIGGGFAAPFLLGGLTGALLTPNFYPRPYYPPYPYYPPHYYPYRRRRYYY